MKLCWVIPDDRGGGVALTASACCQEARAHGHEATLLSVLPLRNDNVDGYPAFSLNLHEPAREAARWLLDWLGRHPVDVLLINGCEQLDHLPPYVPGATRCVYVVHDTAARFWSAAVKYEAELDAIVAVSETVARKFRHRLKCPNKLFVIRNGIRFAPLVCKHAFDERDRLLFLGGDNIHKGAGDALRLWPLLIRQGFQGELHWLGSMTVEFRERMMALPASKSIHLHGEVSRAEVLEIASRCKVFLVLSRAEAFGLATIDAMSMGCVPVAWNINTGTKEICRADETGLFATTGNLHHLAEQVRRACRHHRDFLQNVMRRPRENFNQNKMWRGYDALFRELESTIVRVRRTRTGERPALYRRPKRHLQLVPAMVRGAVRGLIERSARLGYLLRDIRGI